MPKKRKSFFQVSGLFSLYHFFWAWFGARLHKSPGQNIFVIGITGTKGKTTTLELVNAILEAADKKTALLSSVRIKVGDRSTKNGMGNSMPGRGYIQKFLKRASKAKCGYALIEVTSQGVVAHRHRFIPWNMGVITNLAPEHIESHGSFENYRMAKLGFLKYAAKKGARIFLNRDDRYFSFFDKALPKAKKVGYSKSDGRLAEYLSDVKIAANREGEGKFLASGFNEENIAAAVAIAKDLGVSDRIIEQGLMQFRGVPGRMEFIRAGAYTAVVDYAHTPESLEAAYQALREDMTNGKDYLMRENEPRLICILGGAGGGRDRWKRPEMGKIAAHYCDEIILTDEDPYDEKPEEILDEIEKGIVEIPYPRASYIKILDRRAAIQKAVSMMREGDFVIGTGKGSEDWIHQAKGKKISWSEREVFSEMLAEKQKHPFSE